MWTRSRVLAATAAALLAALGAGADGAWAEGGRAGRDAVVKDAERFDGTVRGPPAVPSRAGRPGGIGLPRRVTGGPDYVGSDWGLGKPSFSGLGSRPDGGRGSAE